MVLERGTFTGDQRRDRLILRWVSPVHTNSAAGAGLSRCGRRVPLTELEKHRGRHARGWPQEPLLRPDLVGSTGSPFRVSLVHSTHRCRVGGTTHRWQRTPGTHTRRRHAPSSIRSALRRTFAIFATQVSSRVLPTIPLRAAAYPLRLGGRRSSMDVFDLRSMLIDDFNKLREQKKSFHLGASASTAPSSLPSRPLMAWRSPDDLPGTLGRKCNSRIGRRHLQNKTSQTCGLGAGTGTP